MGSTANGNASPTSIRISLEQIIHLRPKRFQIRKPRRPIRINHQNPLPSSSKEPSLDRSTLPAVLLELHNTNIRAFELFVIGKELERDGGCVVLRPVVYDDYFECPFGGGRSEEVFEGICEHDGEAGGFIISWDDAGEVQRRFVG
jgi:hypothetical protein